MKENNDEQSIQELMLALKQEIPYRWRVQQFSKSKAIAVCVPYIDSRDVMDVLDEVVGPDQWQSDYKEVNGKLFAGIGILIPVTVSRVYSIDEQTELDKLKGEDHEVGFQHSYDLRWVWKWDVGKETSIEKEKGAASDSFKRAAVKWGIGRFLYAIEPETVQSNGPKNRDNERPWVVDGNGKRVYNLTKFINDLKGNESTEQGKYFDHINEEFQELDSTDIVLEIEACATQKELGELWKSATDDQRSNGAVKALFKAKEMTLKTKTKSKKK